MSFADSAPFDVAVQSGGATGGLPLWLQGVPLLTWVQVPQTAMSVAAFMDRQPIIDSGLDDPQQLYGHPYTTPGILAQSGGALRKNGSELLIYGGGGAHTWAGNDVRGLRLEDDNPRWVVRKEPTDVSLIYRDRYSFPPNGDPPTPYQKDGISPNAQHSYWAPEYIDAIETFYIFGRSQVWQSDSGAFDVVDTLDWATKAWSLPGTHPNIPTGGLANWSSPWTAKHPTNETIYRSSAGRYIHEYDYAADIWHSFAYTGPTTDVDRATAAVDGGRNLLVAIGHHATQPIMNFRVYTVASRPYTMTSVTPTGTFAANLYNPFGTCSSGMVFCPDLDCFLWFQDDTFIYTITRGATNADWVVDRLALAGAPPPIDSVPGGHTFPNVYARFQYVPNLKGVILMCNCETNCYFFRTG